MPDPDQSPFRPTPDDLTRLKVILNLLRRARGAHSELSPECREAIGAYHCEDATLTYCLRWGATAVEELLEAAGEARRITLTEFLTDVLTDDELELAVQLGDRVAVRDQIIGPNMARINEALGYENDPNYLSYAVEYIMRETGHWRTT